MNKYMKFWQKFNIIDNTSKENENLIFKIIYLWLKCACLFRELHGHMGLALGASFTCLD